MCLILIGYRTHAEHPLVIAANRDEFFARPTTPAHFWQDQPDIFAGRDEEELGTWMGVTRSGRMAAVTNWTEQEANAKTDLSRGALVAEFLRGNQSAASYIGTIEGERYQGFNFIAFDGEDLKYYSNRTNEVRLLQPGIYGLSNTWLGNKWLRVIEGERRLSSQIVHPDPIQLIDMLFESDEGQFKAAPEKHNAPCFILGEKYGTRSTTALLIGETQIEVREQTYGPMGKRIGVVTEQFALEGLISA